ncbi:hypothetical protein BV20DRAFT_962318 [Pilatotrama ljubarskyi]|nr:hypothetical protein BV20DRAFT_962318 [Pilatotrama ljubarskyi]
MLANIMQVASLILAFAVSASLAKPLYLADRDAVSPPITNPTAQTVWRTGETQTVTWDVAALNGAPPSNPLAKIILGTLTADGDEHLMFDSPLVSGFPILGGNVSLTVPSVPSGANYIVCLFGSSGDISPTFTIIGTDASSSARALSTLGTAAPSPSPSPSSESAAPTTQADALSTSVTSDPSPASATTARPSTASPITAAESPASVSVSSTSGASTGSATATAISTSPSSSATSPTGAGTSGAQRGAVAHAHLWSIPCALLFAFAFF